MCDRASGRGRDPTWVVTMRFWRSCSRVMAVSSGDVRWPDWRAQERELPTFAPTVPGAPAPRFMAGPKEHHFVTAIATERVRPFTKWKEAPCYLVGTSVGSDMRLRVQSIGKGIVEFITVTGPHR